MLLGNTWVRQKYCMRYRERIYVKQTTVEVGSVSEIFVSINIFPNC